ncbi:MetQ/NlpA family ABC transporter substrate-binding protein [Trichlorobacter ammonificans]|uniref:Methionine ABC transporter substrate-binding protein n=1 Tax=Trichlorobacter ammonificans TaxID=2916410 RepID=A0ABN8HLX2_9BACT|nr:MetQ/NlpA family ABC transporter substrate-binding protein [Trichlorobacter ammonificans]CAH2031975.1 Methionine ABC transporter substrate-binding protein [Trichlorobacter ammonificans]
MNNTMKTVVKVSVLALLALSMTVPALATQEIKVGVAPGPYGDLFKKAIKPGLEKKGYKVEIKEFSDYVQPNLALSNGSIDTNLFQHLPYLEKFSKDKGLKISPITFSKEPAKAITVPTAGLGLYSRKIRSVDQLKRGDEITIANDPTNLSRALRFLQKSGLITIKKEIDPAKASEKDIADNPKGLKIRPIEAAQIPRTLDSVSIAVINGNYAIAAGIPLDSALLKEELDENLKLVVAVRTDDLNKPFAKDIQSVLESADFRQAVYNKNYLFKDFQFPAWLKNRKTP